jgi:hypothetical protein
LGMVKMIRIGQSAGYRPKDAMLVYGRPSETAPGWVVSEGLSSRRQPKIQSSL